MQQTKQVCERVCTQTYTETIASGKGKGMVAVVPMGKGKGLGRHLLHKDGLIHKSALLGKGLGMGKGKGAALVNSDCQDVSTKHWPISTSKGAYI